MLDREFFEFQKWLLDYENLIFIKKLQCKNNWRLFSTNALRNYQDLLIFNKGTFINYIDKEEFGICNKTFDFITSKSLSSWLSVIYEPFLEWERGDKNRKWGDVHVGVKFYNCFRWKFRKSNNNNW